MKRNVSYHLDPSDVLLVFFLKLIAPLSIRMNTESCMLLLHVVLSKCMRLNNEVTLL